MAVPTLIFSIVLIDINTHTKFKVATIKQGGEPTSGSHAKSNKYVSKENNLRPDLKIKCILGLKSNFYFVTRS